MVEPRSIILLPHSIWLGYDKLPETLATVDIPQESLWHCGVPFAQLTVGYGPQNPRTTQTPSHKRRVGFLAFIRGEVFRAEDGDNKSD